jgi:arsenite methyltransferase
MTRTGVLPAALVLAAAASPLVLAQHVPTHDEAHRLHADPKAYIAALDDPARDAWQKPHDVITALRLKEGETVADIGAGSGYFALRFARHVGGQGRVYAVDVSPEMVGHLGRRLRDAGLLNVSALLAPPDDPLLPPASTDLVFICNTWHHIEDRGRYLATLKRVLKPGARLAIVDFHMRDLPVGPPASMKISREDVLREVEAAGFRLVQEHEILPHQYFLVFTAPS